MFYFLRLIFTIVNLKTTIYIENIQLCLLLGTEKAILN